MVKRRRKRVQTAAGLSLMMNVPAVMAMRLAKIGRGGRAAPAEFSRMITEKMAAGLEAQAILARSLLGGRPAKASGPILRLYARKVAANKRRLSK